MKRKIITGLIAALLLSNTAFAQLSFHFSSSNYRTNEEISYENSETQNAYDTGVRYNFQLSEMFGLSVGIFRSERISDTEFFSVAKVNEMNLNLPVMFNYGFPIGEKTRMIIALGGYMSTPVRQEILFPKDAIIPYDYRIEHGPLAYYKFGVISTFGIKQKISDGISLFVNANASKEYEKLSITDEDKPVFFHFSKGWEAGIEFRFRK